MDITEVKEKKRELTGNIRTLIEEFEAETQMIVTRVSLHNTESPSGNSTLIAVNVEVRLK